MRRGLTVTLVMVAIALSGYRALGRAPVVSDILDIVVGDAESATPPNVFVYPNAIDLNAKVNDPDGSDDQIIWSFLESSGTYLINGVGSLASAADATNPAADKKIAGPSVTAQDPDDSDSGLTATVRNATLSPIGGPNVDPGVAGIVAGSAKVITLFASDGATIGQTDFIAYTANDELDHTSPTTAPPVSVVNYNFAGSNRGWMTKADAGNIVSFAVVSNGICLEVPAAGSNDGEWQSPYGATPGVDLVANSVYRCRITAHNAGNGAETVPMWMFLFDNGYRAEDAPEIAANAFAGEFVFLDAPGQNGANTVGVARTDFECWIAPASVQTMAWNDADSGGVAAAADPYNDIRLRFRVFDRDGLGYGAETDLGRVCLDEVQVDRYLLADLQRGTVAYDKPITLAGADKWTVLMSAETDGRTDPVTDSGGVTLDPTVSGGTGWIDGDVLQLVPGDNVWGDYSDAQLGDDFPIVWTANKLYLIEVVMSAPGPATLAGMQNPGDVIRLGMDCPTNEMAVMNFVDANSLQAAGAGATSAPALPKATPDTFTALFYTHNVSLVPVASARRLRPRIDILNATAFVTGQGVGGLDPTKFHSCKVTELGGY